MRVTLSTSFDEADRKVDKAIARGVLLAAEHVLQVSRDVVPIEEGTLERSGVAQGDGPEAVIAYGGGDVVSSSEDGGEFTLDDLAIVQHERHDYRHAPGRSSNYLGGPLLAEAATVRDIVATQVGRALR